MRVVLQVLLALVALIEGYSVNNLPLSEVLGLKALYDSTNGKEWTWSSTTAGDVWNFTGNLSLVDPCNNWQGVDCTCISSMQQYEFYSTYYDDDDSSLSGSQCNIRKVYLSYYGLDGVLPSDFFTNLPYLTHLHLSGNNLYSTIPSSISSMSALNTFVASYNFLLEGTLDVFSSLKSLQVLDININSFSGSIEPLATLTNLLVVSLGSNYLSGGLDHLSQLTSLQRLFLGFNDIEGNLSALSNLRSLTYLGAQGTLLTGDLSGLRDLIDLRFIALYYNDHSGTLEHLQQLANMTYLDVEYNAISGTLESLSSLVSMQTLYLGGNMLTGPLAPGIQGMTSLNTLYLQRNMLTGTITCLTGINSLQKLYLFQNYLSGDLQVLSGMPSLVKVSLFFNSFEDNLEPFRRLHNLTYLDVEFNYITGSIDHIANLTKLEALYLSTNFFSVQSISALASMKNLTDLGLLENQFTGSTELISTFASLTYLEINNNYFSGDISSWSTLTDLTLLDVSDNLLTGTLDALIGCTGLTQFDASSNLLGGNIFVFDGMTQLRSFSVEGNGVTGGLSDSLSLCTELTYLNVNNNFLSGSVPSLSDATYLTALLLANNGLSGALDFIAPSPSNPFSYLTVVDVHNNLFSGSIPASWFGLSNIKYVIAAVNCLDVTFPASVCDAVSLQGLVLDGLHSAPSCSFMLPIRIIDSIYQTTQVVSNIPSCIYELPALGTLHMSGNGITSSLPSDVTVSSSLKELVLSNNDIRGVIPEVFQAHHFDVLDLSYNKISGILSETLVVNESISLLVNRLSGPIPPTLYSTKNVDILSGNIYSCDKETIRRLNDATTGRNYTCGSSTFTYAGIIWSMVITLVVAFVAVSYVPPERVGVQCLRRVVEYILSVRMHVIYTIAVEDILIKHDTKVSISKNIHYFMSFTGNTRKSFGLVTAVIVFVYLPIYVSLNSCYSTYSETYAWSATIAYLSGVTPAAVLLVLYSMSIVIPTVLYREHILNVISCSSKSMIFKVFEHVGNNNEFRLNKAKADNDDAFSTVMASKAASLTNSDEYKRIDSINERNKRIALTVIMVMNVAIVTSINGCYVYLSIKYSNTIVAICEFLLAGFKSVWTSILLSFIEYVENKISKTVSKDKSRHLNFLTVMLIVNNIVLPCLALSLVNPDCFYNALYSKNTISATFSYSVCGSYDDYLASTLTCLNYFTGNTYSATETLRYSPPYSYSNECSSAILTSYVPVFLYSALFVGLLNPFIDVMTAQFLSHAARYPDNKCLAWMVSVVNRLKHLIDYIFDSEYTDETKFNQTGFCLAMNSSFIVLVTFGALSPFLAVMTFLSINSTLLYAEYKIGQYLLNSMVLNSEQGNGNMVTNPMSSAVATVRREGGINSQSIVDLEWENGVHDAVLCTQKVQQLDTLILGVENRIIKSLWQSLPSIGLFYSLFLWDIAGDEVGFRKALWGPVLMMTTVLLVFVYPSMHYYMVTASLKWRGRIINDHNNTPEVQWNLNYIYGTQSSVKNASHGAIDDPSGVQLQGVQLTQNPSATRPGLMET